MSLIKRTWKPEEADNWSREDTITVIVSPLIYVLLTVGCALSFLLIPVGFVMLFLAIVLLVIMVTIIDPKLKASSQAYERKQKEYLEELERKVKWEE